MAQNKKNNKNNKSSKKKVTKDVVTEKVFDMYVMLSKEVSATNIIDALKERGLTGLDVWEAMGVFSLEASEGNAVEFEEVDREETFVDPSDLSFMKNRQIQSVYAFRATEAQMAGLLPYFKAMTEVFGGFVCSDSEDFQPILAL